MIWATFRMNTKSFENPSLFQRARPHSVKAFVLKRANESDLEFIRGLSAQVFRRYGKYDEIVPAWLLQPGVITLLILKGSYPLGFAMLALTRQQPLEPRRADLLAIAILPAHERRGVGSALLSHMEKLALDYGVREIHLWTAHDNLQALYFFQKAGFEIIGSEGRYYPRGQPAYNMSKSLYPQ